MAKFVKRSPEQIDGAFQKVLKLMKTGLSYYKACARLKINRRISAKFTPEQRRAIKEQKALMKGTDALKVGKRKIARFGYDIHQC